MSPSIKELAAAYCLAQAQIEGAVKDKTNPAFRSKYADLGSVVDAIKPALSANGLSFVQCPHDAENAAKVETILLHKSGEWISLGEVTVPVTKHDAHGFGSALTYARRYGLLAAFGVAPEDDDGNAAAKAAPTERGSAKPAMPAEMKRNAFESMPEDEKEFLRKVAADATALVGEDRSDDAHGYIENQKLDLEEQLALWFLLDSKTCSALKKAKERAELERRAADRNKHQQSRPAAQVPN